MCVIATKRGVEFSHQHPRAHNVVYVVPYVTCVVNDAALEGLVKLNANPVAIKQVAVLSPHLKNATSSASPLGYATVDVVVVVVVICVVVTANRNVIHVNVTLLHPNSNVAENVSRVANATNFVAAAVAVDVALVVVVVVASLMDVGMHLISLSAVLLAFVVAHVIIAVIDAAYEGKIANCAVSPVATVLDVEYQLILPLFQLVTAGRLRWVEVSAITLSLKVCRDAKAGYVVPAMSVCRIRLDLLVSQERLLSA